MSIARKDDRHKEEMVEQIASMFEAPRDSDEEDSDATEAAEQAPRIRITGDKRMSGRRRQP